MTTDDLRGNTTVYTAKDVLVRLDSRVESLDSKMDHLSTAIQILVSQNLNDRVGELEKKEQERVGAANSIRAIFGTSVVAALLALVSILKVFGII